MGCASSTQVSSFDEFEEKVHKGHSLQVLNKDALKRRLAAIAMEKEKQIDTTELGHIMPHTAEDESTDASIEDGPVRKWTEDSEDSWGAHSLQGADVQINVPDHLRKYVREEPILKDFSEPAHMESSWTMPSLQERAKYLPCGIMVPPDREMHNKHLKNLDGYLAEISKSPAKLEAKVSVKKMVCGMEPVPSANNRNKVGKNQNGLQGLKNLKLF